MYMQLYVSFNNVVYSDVSLVPKLRILNIFNVACTRKKSFLCKIEKLGLRVSWGRGYSNVFVLPQYYKFTKLIRACHTLRSACSPSLKLRRVSSDLTVPMITLFVHSHALQTARVW